MGLWEEYKNINDALAEIFYSPDNAGRPAYLDFEDSLTGAFQERLNLGNLDPLTFIALVVKKTLNFSESRSKVLDGQWSLLTEWWNGEMLDPPPVLALLSTLSIAAENMQSGVDIGSNNFYGRFAELLKISEEDKEKFIYSYTLQHDGKPTSEWMWESLNAWLEMRDGNRGLPTAYAESLTHIGFALSQAVVRQFDRNKFPGLFSFFGLAPRSSLQVPEMATLFDEWISRDPCPLSSNLHRIWQSSDDAKERISEVACQALLSWDGSGVENSDVAIGRFRGLGNLRLKTSISRFPSRRLNIELLLGFNSDERSVELGIRDNYGNEFGSIMFNKTAPGWYVVSDSTDIDASSLLRAKTILQHSDTETKFERLPRTVIPLRRDEILMGFVEQERVGLDEDMMILAPEELSNELATILAKHARPGYVIYEELNGLPIGWHIFDSVQIPNAIIDDAVSKRQEFNVLQPLAKSNVSFEGGLRLPGNIEKYSTILPPELRVTSNGANSIEVFIESRNLFKESDEIFSKIVDGPVLLWPMEELNLDDGDYSVVIHENGSKQSQQKLLRLRSANSRAIIENEQLINLSRPKNDCSFVFTAQNNCTSDSFEIVPEIKDNFDAKSINEKFTPRWWSARKEVQKPDSRTATIIFPAVDSDSCFSGAHHWILPLADGTRTKDKSIEGYCKRCGIIKRHSLKLKYFTKRNVSYGGKAAPAFLASELEVVSPVAEINYGYLFDALCHVQQGNYSAFKRVALQVEPSEIFVDAFIRNLENLGHIEVSRDDVTLEPVSWRVNYPTLTQLSSGKFVLTGFRNQSMMSAIDKWSNSTGIEVSVNDRLHGLSRVRFETDDIELIQLAAKVVGDAYSEDLRISTESSMSLASVLPPLSEVIPLLPKTSAITGKRIEAWDSIIARFKPSGDSNHEGAFRLQTFARTYIYRDSADVGKMSGIIGDARFVKYIAALKTGMSLVGYDHVAEVLYAPMGAELPGLYGRCAVMATGNPPIENSVDQLIEYHGVKPELAARLTELLMS